MWSFLPQCEQYPWRLAALAAVLATVAVLALRRRQLAAGPLRTAFALGSAEGVDILRRWSGTTQAVESDATDPDDIVQDMFGHIQGFNDVT